MRAYLDHNATSPLRPEARAALVDALDRGGNASSVHKEGRGARALLEAARAEVAALAGADPRGVIFTSGATEANALALSPSFERGGAGIACDVLLLSAVEHPAVLRGHRFAEEAVEILPVDGEGRLDLSALEQALGRHQAAGRRALVALMVVNNETGVIQPVAEAARIARAHGALVHCDAVQAGGRIPLDIAGLGVDFLCFSAHKLGGPAGAGALVAADWELKPRPLLSGGGQERGRRAGTENLPAIAGFGAAARVAKAGLLKEGERLAALRHRLESALANAVGDVHIMGAGAERVANTSCLAFPGLKAETLVIALDLAGVAVSAGAACSSGKVTQSHVLKAMGVPDDLARGAIRLSLGWDTREEDVDFAIAAIGRVVSQLKGGSARAA